MFKRIKRITSHIGMARFNAAEGWIVAGYIPRQADIPSPYAYSPTHIVRKTRTRMKNVNFIVVETRHKTYDVFEVPEDVTIYKTDQEATDVYIADKFGGKEVANV